MNNLLINGYGPAAVIVLGYIIAAYWQAKRFEDLKDMLVAKIDKLEGEFNAKIDILNVKIDKVEGILSAKLDSLDKRVQALENEIHSPLVKR